ncbi:MAG: conjugal transfer protein TraX [Defluviitaleaceae bacterium]|nr:conjugal transfer protein TraX [Defluviitaleaceae bacterium]
MSSLALKLVAIITMTIDHIGVVYQSMWQYAGLANFMRGVGRIAFPLYIFLIAEGMRKSKNRQRYLAWLFIFAVISIVPFSLFRGINSSGLLATVQPRFLDVSTANILFELFLGALAIFLFDLCRKYITAGRGVAGHVVGLAAPIFCAYLAHLINVDYTWMGMAAIFATYYIMSFEDNKYLKNLPKEFWRYVRIVPITAWAIYYYNIHLGSLMRQRIVLPATFGDVNLEFSVFAAFALIAPLLILLYNGEPGNAKLRGPFKIWFYIYYPAHLLAIFAFASYLRINQ